MKIIKIANTNTNTVYHKVESYLTTLLDFYKSGGKKGIGDGLMIAYFQQIAAAVHYVERLGEVLDEYLPEIPQAESLQDQVKFMRKLFQDIYDPSHPVRGWVFDVGPRDSYEKERHVGFWPNAVRQRHFKEEVDDPYQNVREETFRKHVPYLEDFRKY